MADSLPDFAAAVDRVQIEGEAQTAEVQRQRLQQLFPRDQIAQLPLEKYVVGLGERGTLCYEFEFGSPGTGSIKGGSARKHLIYFSKDLQAMRSTLKGEPDPQTAWLRLRAGLVSSIDLAAAGRWSEIDTAPVARYVPALRLKILHVLFPDDVLPVFSLAHLRFYLEQLGVTWKPAKHEMAVAANRRLLQELRAQLPGWNTQALGILLFRWRRTEPEESLEDFAASFDRAAWALELAQAEAQRIAFVTEFPLSELASLPLGRYVAPDQRPEGMIYWLEANTPLLGSAGARPPSAEGLERLRATGLFKKEMTSFEEAEPIWVAWRAALVESLAAAQAGRWEQIEAISPPNGVPSSKRNKLLHLYFPEEYLPIYRHGEIGHYLEALGQEMREPESAWDPLRNRRLLEHLRSLPELEGWSTGELARLLAAWSPGALRAFKIAPGEAAVLWKDCVRDSVIAVGWGGTGDLATLHTREELKKRMLAAGYRNPAKVEELWTLRSIKVGDFIVANQGKSRILGIGEVVPPGYEYLQQPYGGDFNHVLHVEWDFSGARDIPPQKQWGLITVAELTAAQRRLILGGKYSLPEGLLVSPKPMPALPLNRILYGPPGTGKTYSVIRQAAAIVDRRPHDDLAGKRRYDELCTAGRIRLTTFHQSFGYEDFIEGIRPEMDREGAGARFVVRDGVFKEIATEALFACLERVPSSRTPSDFDARWDDLLAQISEAGEMEIPGLRDDTTWTLAETSQGNLMATNKTTGKELSCGRKALAAVWSRAPERPKLTSMEVSQALGRGAHFGVIAAVYNYLRAQPFASRPASSLPVAGPGELQFLPDKAALVQSYLQSGHASGWRLREDGLYPPFVLIIDEINRGNISRIFGELITLIEDDKRHAAENALQVTLPVSRELFVVPPNLWLLGTMNTADKSLALLDVALRRRFDFEELAPNFGKCAGLPEEMRMVLARLNDRLEVRKDRDHRIGHAFFAHVEDAEGFNRVFRSKVVPLLQEYFHNDDEGARYVLGERETDESAGFLRPLRDGEPRGTRHRWRWFTDEEPALDCWARLQLQLGPPGSGV